MSKRSEEWMAEFGHYLENLDAETKELVLDGSIEICPCCGEMSAYAWQDANAYEEFDRFIPGGFVPEKGKIAHIPTASGFEWQCGHCLKHLADADSPVNYPAYSHSED